MKYFNHLTVNKFKYYDGNNGNKLCLEDEWGNKFLLKGPAKKKDKYTNGCISEHLGCSIFKTMGFNVQETELGFYNFNGQEKLCVLCKDFESEHKKLFKFAEIKNGIIKSSQSGFGVELEDVLTTIEEQTNINSKDLKEFFWDMFIADAFLGNFDRHNGNWGFLLDEKNKTSEIAPIYDCGSCLYPRMLEENMKEVLNDQSEIEHRVYIFPNSALKINNEKINYFNFISSDKYPDCTAALKRISSKIDLDKINRIIDETEYITDLQKTFYKTMLKARKEIILDKSLEIILLNSKNIEDDLDEIEI